MRRASSGEEFEWVKTCATKSIRFGTWIVTMSGFSPLSLGLERPRHARDHPASRADFHDRLLWHFQRKISRMSMVSIGGPARLGRFDRRYAFLDSIVANLR